ncbi:MAG: hypothetical protein BGO27_06515 [Alphaproteobacteria bacterium 33-17]|nr:MAG: hypothetical protein BGO27_06515 [Alphaproteobacteria bacterium 33-17]
MIWDNKLLAEALGIEIDFEFKAKGFYFNSKEVRAGDVFIALKGENGDGHLYIESALHNGASVVIAEKNDLNDPRIVVVENTLDALYKMAHFKRSNVKATYIGVTGSVGKTSTKEMLASYFSAYGKTTKTEGNFNNDLGVPITLSRMPMDATYAIIEMGMSSKGEIEKLTKIVNPKICIVTNVEAVHLEFFDSVEGIADAKSEIFMGTDESRIAVINIDNQYAPRLISNAKKYGVKNIKTFGKSKEADIKLKSCGIIDSHTFVKVLYGENEYEYQIPVVGEHQAYNSMVCILAASSLSLNPSAGISTLKDMEIAKGRGEIFASQIDGKRITIVNEAYNASPAAVKAVLMAYGQKFAQSRKIAVLGDMKELGESAQNFHANLADDIYQSGIDLVVCVGDMMKNLYNNLEENYRFGYFINIDEMMNSDILKKINDGDVLIFKGSNSMRLYKMADSLKLSS